MDTRLLTMTDKELLRFNTVKNIVDKRIATNDAAKLLKLSIRQAQRLVKAYLKSGPEAFISKKRGNPSNRAYPNAFKREALNVVRKNYYDFGPTLAAEKLAERNGIKISKETARQWMIEDGIWRAKVKREPRIHPPRCRRASVGELIQIDGSEHDWFEGRGPRCTLLVFIDDATSTIMKMLFVECESTINYFKILIDYFITYGKPLGVYSDKHGVFRVNHNEAKSGNGLTQYGRALGELGIDIIYAHSPQAKGRVERSNRTLQDRLVKELRLQNISSITEANGFIETFRKSFNKRFSQCPRSDSDAHVPLSPNEHERLPTICSVQTERTISKDMLVRHENGMFKIEAPGQVYRLAREKVLVCEDINGQLKILHKDKTLQFKVYNKTFKNGHILTSKELNYYLDKKMMDWTAATQATAKEYFAYEHSI